MSYLVLARKWRPKGFEDLTGQEPIVRILRNSIAQGKIAHAYVFSGPRGVGKTSTARILAKSLNCERGPTAEPCGSCHHCTAITDGSSVDVMEIDGASNNSVDNIRDLRERVKYAPAGGRYKVYIIDETHMLSTSAFNALLKTLEEPPPHVIFVLATTAPSKIPLTVMSRCQHLPFRRISVKVIKDRLHLIAEAEGITVSDKALGMLARAADGSMRDALTLLDQAASVSASIGEDDVRDLVGGSDSARFSDIAAALIEGDRKLLIEAVAGLVDIGTDIKAFTKDLIKYLRDILVVSYITKSSGKSANLDDILDVGDEELEVLHGLAGRASDEHILLVLAEMIKAEAEVKSSFAPRVALEMALIRASYLSAFKPVTEALKALRKMDLTEQPGGVSNPVSESAKVKPDTKSRLDETAQPKATPVGINEPVAPVALLKSLISEVADPKLSAVLLKAKPELDGGTLILNFSGAEANFYADSIAEHVKMLASLSSRLQGMPAAIEIRAHQPKVVRKKDLREKALLEPSVREALELFEGRIVDVRLMEEGG